MKRILMVAMLAIAFCGSMVAQETHWPEFNYHDYMFNMPLVSFVQINGEYVTAEDNWADLEVGVFVDGVVRGHTFLADYTEDGDPYPIIELAVYYDQGGETATFKLYDHSTGTEYEECEVLNIEYVTGDDHTELYFDYGTAAILNFTGGAAPGGFEKPIVGFGDVTNTTNYYLVASPIGSVDPTAVTAMIPEGAPYDLFSFDQSQNEQEWRNYKDNSFTLEPGVGYLYANQDDVTLVFMGSAYDGEGTFPLMYDDNANLTGWNLVGNPYGNSATIDKSDFYVMNEDGSEIVLAERSEVYAMEGIFVIAEEEGDEITFTETMGGEIGGGMGEDDFKFDLRVNGTGNGDVARIRFGMGSMLPKLQIRDNSTKLYFPMGGDDYAVVRSEEMGEMPVNFKATSNGTYSLSYNSNTEFSYLHLVDNMTGADVDLLETPVYSFEATTSDYASRFKLVFATGNNEESFAFYSNGSFVVSNEGEATLQVLDVTGRILRSETISGSANVNVNAANGVYMLRLINGDNMKVQKVVVR